MELEEEGGFVEDSLSPLQHPHAAPRLSHRLESQSSQLSQDSTSTVISETQWEVEAASYVSRAQATPPPHTSDVADIVRQAAAALGQAAPLPEDHLSTPSPDYLTMATSDGKCKDKPLIYYFVNIDFFKFL